MATINLNLVDWLILAFYFGFILSLGYYLKRFTKSQEDFFLAGRKNSAWVAGIAFHPGQGPASSRTEGPYRTPVAPRSDLRCAAKNRITCDRTTSLRPSVSM